MRPKNVFAAVGPFVANHSGIAVAGFDIGQTRIEHDRHQRDHDPGPRPDAVVRDREPQCRQIGMPFIACRHHALRDVPATPGLLSRVPARPPLHTEIRDEGAEGKGQGLETWLEIQMCSA